MGPGVVTVPRRARLLVSGAAAAAVVTAVLLALSQEAFADLVGVHPTYMGGLERGERNLTLRSVERIAESIPVDPLELLRG